MAKAIQCDRCGKFDRQGTRIESSGSGRGLIKRGEYTMIGEKKLDIVSSEMDLCDSCLDELIVIINEWWKKPKQ